MDARLKYRGRVITAADVAFIGQLIAAHPAASRRGLSQKLCVAWNWVQANGAPRDMVCRGLLLALHRAGHIQLPPQHHLPPNPLARCLRPPPVALDTTPLHLWAARAAAVDVPARAAPLAQPLLQQPDRAPSPPPPGLHPAGRRAPQTASTWSRPARGLAPPWRGPPRRGTGVAVTASSASSAGRLRPGAKTFASWPTTCALPVLILPLAEIPHLASHLLGCTARWVPRDWTRLGRAAGLLPGDLQRSAALPGHGLPGRQPDLPGPHHRPGQEPQTNRPNRPNRPNRCTDKMLG